MSGSGLRFAPDTLYRKGGRRVFTGELLAIQSFGSEVVHRIGKAARAVSSVTGQLLPAPAPGVD